MRNDGRQNDQLRPLRFKRKYTRHAPGSVLVTAGETIVLCTASVETSVPPWLAGKGKGWVTAEYNMLPSSTSPRKARDRAGKVDGRTMEIQRLIGRALRCVVDLKALGECSITVDCDVLQADGGTRTASITGAYVALVDAVHNIATLPDPNRWPIIGSVAAVSIGIVGGKPLLDLDYSEDSTADVDMNVVMTGRGEFIEVQGTGEQTPFSESQLTAMLRLARRGITQLQQAQQTALGKRYVAG